MNININKIIIEIKYYNIILNIVGIKDLLK